MAKERPLLEYVSEGMKVVDGVGDDIGKVDLVRFADSGSPNPKRASIGCRDHDGRSF